MHAYHAYTNNQTCMHDKIVYTKIILHIKEQFDQSLKNEGGQVVNAPNWIKVLGSNPAGGRIQLMTVWPFIAQSLPLSSFHPLDMT